MVSYGKWNRGECNGGVSGWLTWLALLPLYAGATGLVIVFSVVGICRPCRRCLESIAWDDRKCPYCGYVVGYH